MTALASPFWLAPRPAPRAIDPVAFFVALILAPVILTALTFYLIIPTFALALGAPTYLTFGATAFALALRRGIDGVGDLVLTGLLANLASAPAVFAFAYGTGISNFALQPNLGDEAIQFTAFIVGFGIPFSALWSLAFALLYRRLRRSLYQ